MPYERKYRRRVSGRYGVLFTETERRDISLNGVIDNDTAWGGYGKVNLREEALQVYTADMEDRNRDYGVVIQGGQ